MLGTDHGASASAPAFGGPPMMDPSTKRRDGIPSNRAAMPRTVDGATAFRSTK